MLIIMLLEWYLRMMMGKVVRYSMSMLVFARVSLVGAYFLVEI